MKNYIPVNCNTFIANLPSERSYLHQYKVKSKFTLSEIKKATNTSAEFFDITFKDCLLLGLITKNKDNTYSKNERQMKTRKTQIEVHVHYENNHGNMEGEKSLTIFDNTAKGQKQCTEYLTNLVKTENNGGLKRIVEIKTV